MRLKAPCAALAAIVAAFLAAFPATAGTPAKSTSGVWSFADTSKVGTSTLLRLPGSIQMTIHTTGLPAGDVVTVWWILFNNPAACSNGEPANPVTGFPGTKCGFFDLFVEEVQASAVHATGHVIGENGVGNYAAYLSTDSGRHQVLFGPGLVDPLGADVHLVLHPHGGRDAFENTVGHEIQHFGCDTCADLQFAAHETS